MLGIHTIYSMCTVRFKRNGQQNLLTQRSGNNATFTMTSTNIKVNENKKKHTQKNTEATNAATQWLCWCGQHWTREREGEAVNRRNEGGGKLWFDGPELRFTILFTT